MALRSVIKPEPLKDRRSGFEQVMFDREAYQLTHRMHSQLSHDVSTVRCDGTSSSSSVLSSVSATAPSIEYRHSGGPIDRHCDSDFGQRFKSNHDQHQPQLLRFEVRVMPRGRLCSRAWRAKPARKRGQHGHAGKSPPY
jgi:hypothetical protein